MLCLVIVTFSGSCERSKGLGTRKVNKIRSFKKFSASFNNYDTATRVTEHRPRQIEEWIKGHKPESQHGRPCQVTQTVSVILKSGFYEVLSGDQHGHPCHLTHVVLVFALIIFYFCLTSLSVIQKGALDFSDREQKTLTTWGSFYEEGDTFWSDKNNWKRRNRALKGLDNGYLQ